jgi:hypothetical protein
MNQETSPAPSCASPEKMINLGKWLGRHEAFGLVAGRCSAADAESLRRIREDKLFLDTAKNWDEFCTRELRSSRRRIDNQIRLLKEYGPGYFQMNQLLHVTEDEYRLLAPHISEDGLRLDNEVIALLPENCERVAEAVARLKSEAGPSGESYEDQVQAVVKRCNAAAAALESLKELDSPARGRVALALHAIDRAAREFGLGLPGVIQ